MLLLFSKTKILPTISTELTTMLYLCSVGVTQSFQISFDNLHYLWENSWPIKLWHSAQLFWRQFHSSTMSGQLFAKQSDASLHWSLGQIDASCSGAPLFPGGRALGKEWLIWLLSRSKMSPVKWNRFRAGCSQNFSAVYTVMKTFCNNNKWQEKTTKIKCYYFYWRW